MKNYLTLMLLSVLSVMIIACGGTGGGDNKADIVCLGDSLTAGMSATTVYVDDKSKAYPAILQKKLNAVVFNAGVSGNTTADALARLQSDVIDKDPAVVIICLGGNDFFYSSTDDLTDGTAIKTIKSGLSSIIQGLDKEERLVVVAKFYNDASARSMLSTIGITDTIQQSSIIAQADTAYTDIKNLSTTNIELLVVDSIWSNIWGTANMSADGIHPNASGYAIMADNYFDAIETELAALGFVE